MSQSTMTAARAREIRRASGMTAEALARRMRVSGHTVGAWERGRAPISGPASLIYELIADGTLDRREVRRAGLEIPPGSSSDIRDDV